MKRQKYATLVKKSECKYTNDEKVKPLPLYK